MKAKAMVVPEPGRLEMREFEVLPPAGDQALVKTLVTSVCATDLKVFEGHTPLGRYPLIMGHEISGEVVEVGPRAAEIHGIAPGDRITVEPYVPCGHCRWSRSENFYHLCPHAGLYGISLSCDQPPHLTGGYAEYFYVVPGALVHRLGEGVPPLAASLSSVVGNGVRWVKTLGKITFGESLVISGPGSQGLASLAAAKEAGARPIVVLGLSRDRARLELALEFGADHVVDVEKEDPRQAVERLIPGGADIVIETSGTPEGISAALEMLRPAGRMVTIGLSGGLTTSIRFDDLVWRNLTIISGLGQAGNVADAMKIINSGRYPFEKINNFTYRLEELGQALEDTKNRPEGFIKGAVLFAEGFGSQSVSGRVLRQARH